MTEAKFLTIYTPQVSGKRIYGSTVKPEKCFGNKKVAKNLVQNKKEGMSTLTVVLVIEGRVQVRGGRPSTEWSSVAILVGLYRLATLLPEHSDVLEVLPVEATKEGSLLAARPCTQAKGKKVAEVL